MSKPVHGPGEPPARKPQQGEKTHAEQRTEDIAAKVVPKQPSTSAPLSEGCTKFLDLPDDVLALFSGQLPTKDKVSLVKASKRMQAVFKESPELDLSEYFSV